MKGGKLEADASRRAKASKKAESKLAVKKAAQKATPKPVKKAAKGGKDPNMPKRPASAFLIFMEDFRMEFKEKNPHNKLVSAVSKAGGEKWKSLTQVDKAPFFAQAAKRKTEYQKNLDAYNKKLVVGGDDADVSDKSNSEVHDEDDEEGSEEEKEEDEE